jgi:hypothetical protein
MIYNKQMLGTVSLPKICAIGLDIRHVMHNDAACIRGALW